MATEQKRILLRRGNKADLVVTDLQPGEPIMALDQDAPGVKGNGGNVIWSATLDSNGDVKQDPASYGKANGGAILPSALPTAATMVKLLGGTLSLAGFGDFAAAVQHGSDSTGEYWKFDSGLLKYALRITGSDPYSKAWGSCYTATATVNYTFPIPFVATPYAVASPQTDGAIIDNVSFTSTQLQSIVLIRAVSGTANYSINVLIEGRWK